MFWLLLHAVGAPLNFGFPSFMGAEIQLDHPTLAFDYRVIEQITEPWLLDSRLERSCILKNVRVRPRSLEFSFRTDLKWSDGSPIPVAYLMAQFRSLTSQPRFHGILKLSEGPTHWTLSWPDAIHTIAYTLQRSEFGLINETNRTRRSWATLGPTSGPFRIEATRSAFQIVPNIHYPSDCGMPSQALAFVSVGRENPTGAFLSGKIDILQMDSDRTKESEMQTLLDRGATEIGLGTSAVWTAIVFSTSTKDRSQWRQRLIRCVREKKLQKFSGPPLELVASDVYSTSRTLRSLGDCFGENLKVSFLDPAAFTGRRLSGLVPTFNHLGLRFPDPDDKWVFLREFYPYLKTTLITDKRLEKARALRKTGSFAGYEALDKANDSDPWIILLDNVKTQIFLRKGLKFHSESDSILRLRGIQE